MSLQYCSTGGSAQSKLACRARREAGAQSRHGFYLLPGVLQQRMAWPQNFCAPGAEASREVSNLQSFAPPLHRVGQAVAYTPGVAYKPELVWHHEHNRIKTGTELQKRASGCGGEAVIWRQGRGGSSTCLIETSCSPPQQCATSCSSNKSFCKLTSDWSSQQTDIVVNSSHGQEKARRRS